jgi:polyribonucleotide nucleotidyltransferase
METTRNKLPDVIQVFFNKLSEYLDTKLLFYGSIQRSDYFPGSSDIDVDVLRPDINSIYVDKVSMIFGGGLFINIKNKIKVLIPVSSLINYKFDASTKTFIKNDKTVVKENDEIKVKITGIKYSKKNFNCFGELI